ncbi:MAG TPA: bifunctional diaminohydroxyphosphoribosylaminopyrimidine deaminase/5-amino-6-(5-phosphoribosylamino)uracil reductase RibD [Candidatus Eisenbacteria bacterium]|nr:bifunctional diaminohydroxyphosphoribosylaminopyrimidine deaminase/5-amino-6-(5-phosphoribosylamino)uracil reductase RibD [Candidatus Eisenbacteria bacterium]
MAETVEERDRRYMGMACRLALRAVGRTSPNPMVGAVLVRHGQIVGRGFHRFAGADHAEIVAIKQAGARARGATLYLNLEPCVHQGRTPPCAPALIKAGIKEVVVGMRDPNPAVAGRGLAALRRAGIAVRSGVLSEQCERLNEAFTKYITRKLPFVTLKLAASLDGRIATAGGDARWVTGSAARHEVHELRNRLDAVLVGAGTVLADNPRLTCRIAGGRDPWRVILDGRLRIPLEARLLHERAREKNIIVTGTRVSARKIRALESLGAQVWRFGLRGGLVPWRAVLKRLARIGITSVLVEGGAATAASALRDRAVDKVLLFYAPKIFGGDGRSMIDSVGVTRVGRAIRLERIEVARRGEDIRVTGYL